MPTMTPPRVADPHRNRFLHVYVTSDILAALKKASPLPSQMSGYVSRVLELHLFEMGLLEEVRADTEEQRAALTPKSSVFRRR